MKRFFEMKMVLKKTAFRLYYSRNYPHYDMERNFTVQIPLGLSTLSVPRNMSALNRRLVSSNRDYRVSMRVMPEAGTNDGTMQVLSAPNGWCTHSLWRHGERLRQMFYDSVGVSVDPTEYDITPEFFSTWPFSIFTDNPYDEFRPFLDRLHWNGVSPAGDPAYGDEAPEVFAEGYAANQGEWDYTIIGLYGNELTSGALENLDETNITLLDNHLTVASGSNQGSYLSVGLVESWLQNTNAPSSALEEVPVRDPDDDNPAMMLQRGTIEDAIEDGMTVVTESNLTRPYALDQVYDDLVIRGQAHFDTDSFSWMTVPSFDAIGGLIRFDNQSGAPVLATVTVHDL